MPRIVDEEERRSSIADAALTLIAKEGLESATFRAIAKESGLSLGAIQHSIGDQAQLRQCIVSRFIQQVEKRLNALGQYSTQHLSKDPDRSEVITLLLLELLPLDEKREAEARIWEAFGHASLKDGQIAPFYRQLDSALDSFCVAVVEQLKGRASANNGSDSLIEGKRLHALLDGLTLQLLTDPSEENRSAAETVLRQHLSALG